MIDDKRGFHSRLKHILIGSTLVGGLALLTPKFIGKKDNNKDKKGHKTEIVTKQRIDITQRYPIETRSEFDSLYNIAKPFLFVALVPSENWRHDFHSDKRGKNVNSVGVGLSYVGVDKNGNLDFSSSNWILTKDYYKKYKKRHGVGPADLTADQICMGTFGWFENMENGRHLDDLFNRLKGTRLTINEFAAIASVYYNSETSGRNVCKYVREHYMDPYACAKHILKTNAPWTGHESRRVHETLLYLNFENYCTDMYNLQVDGNLGTSVAGCKSYRQKLLKRGNFNDSILHLTKEKICNNNVMGGRCVKNWILDITIPEGRRALNFLSPSIRILDINKGWDGIKELGIRAYQNAAPEKRQRFEEGRKKIVGLKTSQTKNGIVLDDHTRG